MSTKRIREGNPSSFPLNSKEPTLKALEMVLFIKSRTKPPANVPNIPQTIVIPPKIRSALLCKDTQLHMVQQDHQVVSWGYIVII
jgi:hypothetical protein